MQPHWTLHLNTGFQVTVPADLDNPVTLTLLEYEDWPEPEHAFLRQLIQPGMRFLDADTGLGLNALAMAQGLNGAGQLTALNADPLFARSVADNGLQAVIQTPTPSQTPAQPAPEQAAGEGAFDLIRLGAQTPLDPRWLQSTEADPEAVAEDQAAVAAEADAMAAESNAVCDPLLVLPSTSASIPALQAAGLSLYRLIPALNALVAFNDNASPREPAEGETPAWLFACHDTRAAWLHEQGRLILSA